MYRYVYFSFWYWWFLAFRIFIGDKNQGKMSHSMCRLKANKITISPSCNNVKMSGLVHIILIFSLERTLFWVSTPKIVGYKKCLVPAVHNLLQISQLQLSDAFTLTGSGIIFMNHLFKPWETILLTSNHTIASSLFCFVLFSCKHWHVRVFSPLLLLLCILGITWWLPGLHMCFT